MDFSTSYSASFDRHLSIPSTSNQYLFFTSLTVSCGATKSDSVSGSKFPEDTLAAGIVTLHSIIHLTKGWLVAPQHFCLGTHTDPFYSLLLLLNTVAPCQTVAAVVYQLHACLPDVWK
ncbi:hypothetical protein UPYG_G00296580 [Umbra pygmaea]|uniref:Uncharacterized protein n=1 Tax=Umbra pygmaea TaxID=75934 RepID=A0ABD0W5S3_UMBPY